ncbi:ankyrin repeat protein [Colletotrichum asianum]
MDPGTALAVVGLSLQVLGGLKEYYNSWKDCDDDVKQFREAMQRLTTMLDHLKSVLSKPHLDPGLVSAINDVYDNLKESAEKMERLLKKVRDLGPPSSMLQKLRQIGRRACYPFRSGTISHFMGFVADMTDDLSLAMQVLTLNTIAEGQGRHASLQDAVAVMDSKQDEGWKRFQRKEFWDWLDPPDHVSSHDHAATLRE